MGDKEEYATYDPELRPKSHDLRVSYWVGTDEDPDFKGLDKQMEKTVEEFGYRFCGSGFDFTERRRDLEFKKK